MHTLCKACKKSLLTLLTLQACSGVINTPLTRHVYGTGYAGWALQNLVSVVGYPWLKSPAQGAATSITAAVSPDLESHSGKALEKDTQLICKVPLLNQ